MLYPYKKGSKGARALAKAVGVKMIKREGSRFKPRPWKTIINWGASTMPQGYGVCTVLNHPKFVSRAGDKLLAFECMDQDVGVVPWTEDIEEAREWVEDAAVVCRTVLRGHSGKGIVIATTEQELVAAPLYTKYINKKSEWRVHIFNDEVLMVQQKVRKKDVPAEEINWKVRNHKNGFIFQQNGINPPGCVIESSLLAVKSLGLDFGAVDVIYNALREQAYVLEVNCAPGLEGNTLLVYTNAFKSALNL